MAKARKDEEKKSGVRTRAIRMPDELWEKFEELGKLEDRPASYLVRKAMEAYLEAKRGKPS